MNRKSRLKIWIVIIIIWIMSFSDWSFAADTTTEESFNILWFSLDSVVSASAWLWVFFARLAWTFLTNKWIYWEILWWDGLLWKLRNVMKNIANFALWFYFVYTIFKWLIDKQKGSILDSLKKKLLRLLIAWVWIQASRFFTAVVIDISTITLTAAGSFPSQVIADSTYKDIEKSINESMKEFISKEYVLFPKDSRATSLFAVYDIQVEQKSNREIVDSIMPNEKDVAWPLYFIWFSILETSKINSINTSSIKLIKATILNTLIKWLTTIVYMFEMILLCIVALVRIIYLWMFIVLSPIAIFLWCLEKAEVNIEKSWLVKDLWKHINPKSFFINVFKPTIIVLCLWIALIFVSLMNKVVLDYTWKNLNLEWAELSSKKEATSNINGNEWDQTYTTVIDSNLVHFITVHTWKTLLGFILSIITVMIVYLIVDLGMKLWSGQKDFMSTKISWLTKWAKDMMKSMPVIPFLWYDANWVPKETTISFKWLKSLPEGWNNKINRGFEDKNDKQYNAVRKLRWLDDDNELSSKQENEIRTAWGMVWWLDALKAKKVVIDKIKTEKWKWLTLNAQTSSSKVWIDVFTNWLNERAEKDDYATAPSEWKDMIWDWKKYDKDKRDLQKLFNNTRYATAYANFFDYEWNYTNFDSIKNLDISKWTPTKTS